MRTLILNQNSVVPNTNNSVYQYKFPGGNVTFKKGDKLALASVQMYYSTFNISRLLQNYQFQYVWVDGSVITINMPDGFYSIADISNYLQFVMFQQGHYLTNASGTIFYFINLQVNSSTYQININTYPISQTLYPPSSYKLGVPTSGNITTSTPTTPVGWSIPSNSITPMLRVLNNSFQQVIGFNAGYYPQGQTGFSTTTPTTSLAQANISIAFNTIADINSIVGTTLTTGTVSIGAITIGMGISGAGIKPNTMIVSGSGSSWVVSISQTVGAVSGAVFYSSTLTQSPSYSTIQTFGSAITPQVSPLSSYVLTCSLLQNNYAVPNSLLYSFSPSGNFGANFTVAPYQYSFIDIQAGQYNSFNVSFLDQNLNPVALQDSNLVILLVIMGADEHPTK
jgi:hypothetical protein